MTRWPALGILLAACQHPGAPPPPVSAPPPRLDPSDRADPPEPPPAPDQPATPETACERFDALATGGCDWTARFPPSFHGASCVASLRTWLAPERPGHELSQRLVGCWASDCASASACMVAVQASAPPPASRKCGEHGTAPIIVDAQTWAARPGATAVHFADVHPTQAAPVEVCGIQEEVEWITRVRCADGSNPYASLDVANDSRDPWLGRGGRCDSILDRYAVACPEATYTIYMDRYVCPPDGGKT